MIISFKLLLVKLFQLIVPYYFSVFYILILEC